MLASPQPLATIARQWLARFERALAQSDATALASLFHPDSHWRDVLALTWNIATVNGADALLAQLRAHADRAKPTGFEIDPNRKAKMLNGLDAIGETLQSAKAIDLYEMKRALAQPWLEGA